MPSPAELQEMIELRKEISELTLQNRKLIDGLSRIKQLISKETQIIVNFDIKDDRPYKGVRLYTMEGVAVGFGEIKVNDSRNTGQQVKLFDDTGNITYLTKLNLSQLLLGEKNA